MSIGYTSYQDPRLDPESWHNKPRRGAATVECAYCDTEIYEDEAYYVDGDNLCEDCLRDMTDEDMEDEE